MRLLKYFIEIIFLFNSGNLTSSAKYYWPSCSSKKSPNAALTGRETSRSETDKARDQQRFQREPMVFLRENRGG